MQLGEPAATRGGNQCRDAIEHIMTLVLKHKHTHAMGRQARRRGQGGTQSKDSCGHKTVTPGTDCPPPCLPSAVLRAAGPAATPASAATCMHSPEQLASAFIVSYDPCLIPISMPIHASFPLLSGRIGTVMPVSAGRTAHALKERACVLRAATPRMQFGEHGPIAL